MAEIAEPLQRQKHSTEIGWINDLIIDLKLYFAGQGTSEPITNERLNEWLKHRAKLEECHAVDRVRY